MAAGRLNFVNDVVPVLTKFGCNSGGCHGRGSGQNGFKLSLFGFDPAADYAALVEEGLGRRISPTAPDESLMLMKATGKIPHGGGVRFDDTSDAYKLIRRWIAEGTPWTDEHDPTLVGILVEPAEQIMTPEANQQLKVTARYSDGSTRDVTATSEYFSQQPSRLQISFAGLAHSSGEKGDAIAMVRYLGIVAVSRLTVPYAAAATQPSAAFEPKNFIDRLVQEKWTKLGLAPSLAASDAVFVRRAYLDAIGTLPTPQEVRNFWPIRRPTSVTNWSIGCWSVRSMPSIGPSNGATPCGTSKSRPITSRTARNSPNGCATPSLRTCPMTSLPAS